jgi:hypothetical protein
MTPETMTFLNSLGPYGLFVLFAVYIILKDVGVIKGKSEQTNRAQMEVLDKLSDNMDKMTLILSDIRDKTKDLYDWHNKEDSEGVKVWYVRKTLEEAIVKLADNIDKQTDILRDLVGQVRQTDEDVQRLKKDSMPHTAVRH